MGLSIVCMLVSCPSGFAQAADDVLINSTVINYVPVADSKIVILPSLAPITIPLTGYDANGDSLSFAIVRPPAKGTLDQLNPSTGQIIYSPSTNFGGRDSFTFTTTDGNATSLPAVVAIEYPATATLSTTTLKFGNQGLVNTSNPKNLVIRNSGIFSLTITGLSLAGPDVSDFMFTSAPLPITLSPSKGTSVKVAFIPRVLGVRTSLLTVFGDSSSIPQSVMLSGNGVEQVTLSTVTVNFAPQIVGTMSIVKSVTVTNNNSTSINIGSITTTGDFSSVTTCGTALPGKAKCKVSVAFTPTATGVRTGVVMISDDATNNPQTLALKGTGK